MLSGVAGDIANAATRTLINGSDFGDNILTALPDTIGQTIGNTAAGAIAASSQTANGYVGPDGGVQVAGNDTNADFAAAAAVNPQVRAALIPAGQSQQSERFFGHLWNGFVSGVHDIEQAIGIDPNAVDAFFGNAETSVAGAGASVANGVESVVVTAGQVFSYLGQAVAEDQMRRAEAQRQYATGVLSTVASGAQALITPFRMSNGQTIPVPIFPTDQPDVYMAAHPDFVPPTRPLVPLDVVAGVATVLPAVSSAVRPLAESLGLVGEVGPAAESSVWELGPGLRGEAIEQALGQNLPQNFRVIDKFENGVATSIKSLDLGAASYQDAAVLDRTLSGYIDKVAGYNGTGPQGWAGVIIPQNQITERALDLAIPNAGTSAQQQIISQAVLNGASKGVQVNVTIYP